MIFFCYKVNIKLLKGEIMIHNVTVSELKELLDNNADITLIDCREQGEWDEARIEQAKLIPLSDFQNQYSEILKDKDAKILIHCRSGKRSLQACQILMQEGYSNLSNIEGGILAWDENGFPILR